MYRNFTALILILLFYSSIFSNPIDGRPITKFSELNFEDNNNWVMELTFPFGYDSLNTDSIVIKVSDLTARIKTKFPDYTQLIVINSGSLTVPLKINRDGDKILLYTYSTHSIRKDSLIFGNYPGAFVGQPVNGYSICNLERVLSSAEKFKYFLTKNPSIGILNDTTGSSAEMRGCIFDTDNNLIKGTQVQTYYEIYTPLKISAEGSYSTKIFRKFDSDSIRYFYVRFEFMHDWGDIEKIEPFVLKDVTAGTVINQDIHLKTDNYAITSVDDKKPLLPEKNVLVINYPNPFNPSTNFYVELPERLRDKEAKINIYNVSGQLIKTIPLRKGITASWDGKNMNGSVMASGVYYYKLTTDNEFLKSGSMILLK